MSYLTRIGHAHLKVRDLSRAIAFYTRFLGLRLTEQVGRAHLGVHAVVGDHQGLGGAGQQVDADAAEELTLGFGDIRVARPDEHVDAVLGLEAEGHRRHRLLGTCVVEGVVQSPERLGRLVGVVAAAGNLAGDGVAMPGRVGKNGQQNGLYVAFQQFPIVLHVFGLLPATDACLVYADTLLYDIVTRRTDQTFGFGVSPAKIEGFGSHWQHGTCKSADPP